jgi:hypothetical protein
VRPWDRDVIWTQSHLQVLGNSDQAAEEKANDRSPLAERSDVRHLVVSNALGFPGPDEEDVRHK